MTGTNRRNRRAAARGLILALAIWLIFSLVPAVSAGAAESFGGTWQSGNGLLKVKARRIRSGRYRLTLVNGGKTLTAAVPGKGAKVKGAAWRGTKAQLWTARRYGDGSVSFSPAGRRSLFLSVTAGGMKLRGRRSGSAVHFKKVSGNASGQNTKDGGTAKGGVTAAADGAKQHGFLRVQGTRLLDEAGRAVVLRGMSSHGLQWYGHFATKNAIGATAAYGANLFRAAMYTEENGYLSNKEAIRSKLYEAVDAAIERNMYVIIDWHILSDGNPKTHEAEAKAFFRKAAERYGDVPNVIYEICNEPNGGTTWRDIASYASAVIPVIRKAAPKSLIIVGTPNWSQDVDAAAAGKLSYENVLYALHFYAGTHGQWLRDKVLAALKKGAPIFASEWGTSAADGNGGVYKKEAKAWLDFLEKEGISWANWSLADKAESSAALVPGANPEDGISQRELSASGKFVFGRF